MPKSKDEEQMEKGKILKELLAEDINEIEIKKQELEDDIIDKQDSDDYYMNILNEIQRNMFEYIERNAVPICEFLSTKKIHNYINKS